MSNSEKGIGRKTNLEWLRIISMLMIVSGHSIVKGIGKVYADFKNKKAFQ